MNEARTPGNLSAAELFRNHAAFVARFLYRSGVRAEAIDDTVQDVFLVVHQRGGYRPGPAKPTTYLAVIASRVASGERRQQRRRDARVGDTPLEEIHAQDDDPALRVERRDDLRRLQAALSRLDPALRDTLLLADFEDETAPAIAHTMGVPVGTVYWRLHEARKKFQRALELADGSRASAAAQRYSHGRARAHGLSRGAKLLAILGWLGGSANRAEAHEFVLAWRGASIDFDLARGLQRHVESTSAARAASAGLPGLAPRLSASAGAGTLPIGVTTALVGGALAALATLALVWRAPGDAPRDSAPMLVARAESMEAEGSPTIPSATGVPAVPATTRRREVPSGTVEARGADADDLRLPPSASAERSPTRSGTEDERPGESENADRTPSRTIRERAPEAPEGAQDERSPRERAPIAEAASIAEPRPRAKRGSSDHHDPLLEARALKRADRLLATDPAGALAIVHEISRTVPEEYLSEERHYIQIMALYGVGRRAEADRAASRFLSRYPSSAFRERVQTARAAGARF